MSSERYDSAAAWAMLLGYIVVLILGMLAMPFMFAYIWGGEMIRAIRKRLRFSKEGSDVT